jgi:hypothetical protein
MIKKLKRYNFPPVNINISYDNETSYRSKYYDCIFDEKNTNIGFILKMLEIFEHFVIQYGKESKDSNEPWLLFLINNVELMNVSSKENLKTLYNIPIDAELIRPNIGINERCKLKDMKYKISYGGSSNHSFYISLSGCKKVLHYAQKYKWRFDSDVDLYKIARGCLNFPVGYDNWTFKKSNNINGISDMLLESEKLNMYSMTHSIFTKIEY